MDVTIDDTICVLATNRDVLTAHLANMAETIGHVTGILLRCEAPCGDVREYETAASIPVTSELCSCGQHWFIKYESE